MKSHELLLRQISNTTNEYWALAGNSAMQTWAQFAGNNPIHEFISGTDGDLNNFQPLLASLTGNSNSNSFNFSNGIAGRGAIETFVPHLIEEYRLANFTPPGQLRRSRASDPIDAMDYKETADDVSKPPIEFVASENPVEDATEDTTRDPGIPSSGGGNPRYIIPIDHPSFPNGDPVLKVIAFESGNVLVGLQTVPEPGTLALMGLGLAGFGFVRRRKLTRRS